MISFHSQYTQSIDGTYLVGGLRKTLGINRSTEAESDTRAEELAVGKSGNTLVVNLGLDESIAIKLVLGGDLETDTVGVSALGIPGSLSTGLDLAVDAVEVRRGKDVEVVCGGDGSGVLGDGVTDGSGVLGDLAVHDIVTNLGTGQETVMADDDVTVERGALEEIKEGAGVEERLAEVEVQLGALALGVGEEGGDNLGLEAVGEGVVKLDLGVQGVGSGPRLCQGKAYGATS